MNHTPRALKITEHHPLAGADPSRDLIALYLQRFDRPHTRKAYRNDLVHFFGQSTVTYDMVQNITFVDINAYLTGLENDRYKASSIKRKIAAIRGFFDWLVALGALEQNPAHRQLLRRVRSTSQRDRPIISLTKEQAQTLIRAAEHRGKTGVRDRALVITLLHCVLRRSEAAAMDVEHIKPLGKYWILELPFTKGGADQYIKMPNHVYEEIERMKDHYGISSGPLWRSLSNNNHGGRLSPHSIYTIIKDTARLAGLPDIGAHTLRHTGCTLAIEAGASLQQVQSHARHKNIETTMIYIHQSDRLRNSAADFIDLGKS
ncbi:tyrosine-type recombinase/integrase [Rhodocaloribacter sp.]